MAEQDASLKERLQSDMKAALKSGEKERLGTIRLILSAVKQKEVDERILLDDAQIVMVLDKMAKQRRESIAQYEAAGRNDLAAIEQAELAIIQAYLPQALSEAEVSAILQAAIEESGAKGIGDMGKVMALAKPKLQGRTDMAAASARVKSLLS
ncbi:MULTISPECIES: GatB/YqeY domain-containing protein [Methylococcus]|uniref:GatB/YqeY domain-containing protein n=1 Tax=Methylococcus capsulatus TaxID=414 RepID=A0ABZ2F8T2_METCP|nr:MULTISPECIES: GatB/YqeY domain-containing protein [Methylococcus]MDF9393019.1 GatB/YqeY domain-containing protein [Methylococcus capsulatus]